MKRLLTLALGIAVLATLGGLTPANAGSIRGTVSQVNKATPRYIVKADGVVYDFVLPKGGLQPKVGAVVEVTYTGTLSRTQPVQATTIKVLRSNTSER